MKTSKKRRDIFDTLKDTLIGRISDADIELIKTGLIRLHKNVKYKLPYRYGKAKIIYYQFHKPQTSEYNLQYLRVKQCVDTSKTYVLGSNDAYYYSKGEWVKYYKYFRFCPKYNMLELVSDYYNKIPIFFHLYNGEYEKPNGIEYIKDIDY